MSGGIVLSEYDEAGTRMAGFGQNGRIDVQEPASFLTDDGSRAKLQVLSDGRVGLVVEGHFGMGSPYADLTTLVGDSGVRAQIQTPIESVVEPSGLIIYPEGQTVHRIDWSGAPDPSFGAAGVATLPDGVNPSILTAAADGSIFATDEVSGRLTKLDSSGQMDPSFGSGGTAEVPLLAGASLLDVELDPAGRLYVLLRTTDDLLTEILVRLRADGTADPGFGGGDGMTDVYFYNPRQVAPLADGSAMLLSDLSGVYMSAVHLQSDGSFDASYGVRGYALAFFGLASAQADAAIAVDADGRVILAGEASRTYASEQSLAIARLSAAAGPDDLDADGILDSRDACPFGASKKHGGCPIDRRSVKVRATASGLRGTVKAHTVACLHARLKLVRLGGMDRPGGIAPRVRDNRGTFEEDLPRGRYRVVAKPRVVEGRARCSPAKSKVANVQ